MFLLNYVCNIVVFMKITKIERDLSLKSMQCIHMTQNYRVEDDIFISFYFSVYADEKHN